NDAMADTLFHKVWNAHAVRTLPSGQTQLFVGLHLVHEVTTPQAFDMLRQHGLRVAFPERTFATVDHIVPTRSQQRPFVDLMAEEMTSALERNCRDAGIRLWAPDNENQGIVHVIGPELGLTQPGMTIACGDSHTSTHGALGAIAFGIGTSQVRDVLASQCLALDPLKVRRIDVDGTLGRGVYAKDVILTIIRRLGVQGGVGYAYEYGGTTLEGMTVDERMTICNMSIEGGARVGYVNPDDTTFAFLRGRPFAPSGDAFDRAVAWWRQIASDGNASYDDRVSFDASAIEPTVTWGINPGQSVAVSEPIAAEPNDEALAFMGFRPGARVQGTRIDVAFIGSCTNGRLSDLEEAARIVRGHRVAPHVKALIVPGSRAVRREAEARGLHDIFIDAGFEWRGAGCSMCLGMNPDRLEGNQISASSSNRNFKGRQGSPTGRTLLMSPAMVAAAAIAGEVVDVREILEGVPA
ncbi:MAG TPA: 3-isopropylmalate dehydratase large subunit, partial [Vicinamibacterales bacterium]|nr:3-isopropylmalate dehydratase large subunit [Vicinamibacterales bacterium]